MKVVVTLDSLLDTRRAILEKNNIEVGVSYLTEIVPNEVVLEEFGNRDRSLLFPLINQTNVDRLMLVIKAEVETNATAMSLENDFDVYINIHPYYLSSDEIEVLKKGFSMRMSYAKNVYIVNQEPNLLYLRSYDIHVDYDILNTIDISLKHLEGDKEALNKIPDLTDAILYGPALLFDGHYYNEVKKQLKSEGIGSFFLQMMKEYSILLSLELVDANFFRYTKDLEGKLNDKNTS